MKLTSLLAGLGVACAVAVVSAALPPETFMTAGRPLNITPIVHASIRFEAGGQILYVHPAQGNYAGMPKADVIVITDIHGDHMAPMIVDQLTKVNTTIYAPAAVAKTITKALVINNGETMRAGRWTIEA